MRKGLYQVVKNSGFVGTCFLRDADLLLLDDSSAVDAKTEQAIIDIHSNRAKRQDDPRLLMLVCCPSGGLDHRLGSRADCEEGRAMIYWLKKAGIMNNTNGNKTGRRIR